LTDVEWSKLTVRYNPYDQAISGRRIDPRYAIAVRTEDQQKKVNAKKAAAKSRQPNQTSSDHDPYYPNRNREGPGKYYAGD
jgi:hypothetical protein